MYTLLRGLVVWALATATCATVARWSLLTATATPAERPGAAATWVAALVLAACAAWAWVVCTVVVAHAVRRAPGRVRGVPAWAARVVLLACGVVVVSATAAPADDPGLDGLPLPDRAVGQEPTEPTAPAPAPRPAGAARPLVVHPGDSLWRLSADRLGPGASDAEVAAATTALYELNREAVGPDPDLIHPGLHLRTPADREEQS